MKTIKILALGFSVIFFSFNLGANPELKPWQEAKNQCLAKGLKHNTPEMKACVKETAKTVRAARKAGVTMPTTEPTTPTVAPAVVPPQSPTLN